jgi:hypothetical protein
MRRFIKPLAYLKAGSQETQSEKHHRSRYPWPFPGKLRAGHHGYTRPHLHAHVFIYNTHLFIYYTNVCRYHPHDACLDYSYNAGACNPASDL